MIELNFHNRKFDGTPVVRDLEVMTYAEARVGDYKPELLKKSDRLNVLLFEESYLRATVDVQEIYSNVPSMGINGITIFKDAMIPMREEASYVNEFFPAGAIIIDSLVLYREDGF